MTKVSLVGAGGKMGLRLTRNLRKSDYEMTYIEINPDGVSKLKDLGVTATASKDSLESADIVILAVPDVILGKVSEQTVPVLKNGALLITLDPAAAVAGKLAKRENIAYFIAHPSHPSIFNWETTPEAQKDFFGGIMAKQTIVCALLHGDDSYYSAGEKIASIMYGPVSKSFRITATQMGLLEPALVETLSSTCLTIIKEGLDEVIKLGVPAEAAREFLLGHLNIQLGVIFGEIPGAVFSDAANKAIVRGRPVLFKEDWKKIFEPDNVMEQINDIIS
jgi:D-apionate oxidoisomerase